MLSVRFLQVVGGKIITQPRVGGKIIARPRLYTLVPVATYRRGTSREGLPDFDDAWTDRSRAGRSKFVERAEELEDEVNIDNPGFFSETQGDEDAKRKRVKLKIIERKYFKPQLETNLLTWDAKEQLRYLHQEFPNEWTIDRLTESFPTSRNGIIRILKSTWRPRTLKEVVRHDRRVQKAWLALAEAEGEDDEHERQLLPEGPLPQQSRYHKLLMDGRLAQAAGIPSLPSPKMPYLLTEEEASRPPRLPMVAENQSRSRRSQKPPPKRALFESIIKDYCEAKVALEQPRDAKEMLYSGYKKHREDIGNSLQEVIGENPALLDNTTKRGAKIKELVPPTQTSAGGRIPQLYDRMEYRKQDWSLLDHLQSKEAEHRFTEQATAVLRGEIEIPENPNGSECDFHDEFMTEQSDYQKDSRKSLRHRINESYNDDSLNNELEKLQMEGTGRISTGESYDDNRSSPSDNHGLADLQEFNRRTKKYRITQEKYEMFEKLRYEVPTKGKQEEAYLYSESAGYQYPFGNTDSSLKLDLSKKRRKGKAKLYQKGQSVYDEDGELLFRVP